MSQGSFRNLEVVREGRKHLLEVLTLGIRIRGENRSRASDNDRPELAVDQRIFPRKISSLHPLIFLYCLGSLVSLSISMSVLCAYECNVTAIRLKD